MFGRSLGIDKAYVMLTVTHETDAKNDNANDFTVMV
jgi:hypothetical protein